MVEDLPQEDPQGQNQRLRLAVLGFFFGGLFLLALGAGLILFKNSNSSDEIQIISSQASPFGEIVVHVDGAVASPGVYKLPGGSRLADAVKVAGGLAADADGAKVNLAAKVADGQKVYIPKIGESTTSIKGTTSITSTTSELININTASESELDKLPGVGPVTAQKIIASRPYSAPEELLTKKVVNTSVYEKIKGLITY